MRPAPELSRLMPLDRLGERGAACEVIADAEELAAVAARLGIPAVTSLTCRFWLVRRPEDPAIVEAEAELSAGVVQVCVVTLEPFEAPVTERFRLRFAPRGGETWDDDPESEDELAYDGGAIDIGEAAVEQLALALDPFPRRPGASLPEASADEVPSPFAALASRRKES